MKTLKRLSALLVAAALSAAWPVLAQTDATTTSTNAPAPKRVANRVQGTIESIDSTNMIVTLKAAARRPETKVKVNSETKYRKSGEPALFADLTVGMRITVTGKKEDDGTWTAKTLNIGIKARAKRPGTTNAPPVQ